MDKRVVASAVEGCLSVSAEALMHDERFSHHPPPENGLQHRLIVICFEVVNEQSGLLLSLSLSSILHIFKMGYY